MEWVEHLWHEGESKSLADDTRSAVLHYFVQLNGHLHGSHGVLRAWSKHELPNRAPSLPTKFLLASAGKALTMGHTRFAVLLLVAFHAVLRTQGLLVVQASHFCVHPRGGVQTWTRPKALAAKRSFPPRTFQTVVYRHSSSCPQLEAILAATWRCHCALPGIRLVGLNCYQRAMVFHQDSQNLRQRGSVHFGPDLSYRHSISDCRQICQIHPSTLM